MAAAYNQALPKHLVCHVIQQPVRSARARRATADELKRTNTLLQEQVQSLSQERDSLRSRLNAARARIDALLERLPVETSDTSKSENP